MNFNKLKHLLFLDIETVSSVPTFEDLNPRLQRLWEKKSKWLSKNEETPSELFIEKAGIYAEFGKIVAISVGFFFLNEQSELALRVKSIAYDDEKKLLLEFKDLLENKLKNPNQIRFVAHNGKEFDYPYICRRMLILGIDLPPILEIRDKKPWEIQHLDTMTMWKFGDYKNFTSLELLAAIFDLKTSKDDIDGSQVGRVYYEEKNLKRIAYYCSKDVALTAEVYLCLLNLERIKRENIIILDEK